MIKKLAVIFLVMVLLSGFVMAVEVSIKSGETKVVAGKEITVNDVVNNKKVIFSIDGQQVLVRKGDNYDLTNDVSFYMNSIIYNYIEPERNMVILEVNGWESSAGSTLVESTSESKVSEMQNVLIRAGESKVLDGVSVVLDVITEEVAYLIVNGQEVALKKDSEYTSGSLTFQVDEIFDNTIDSSYDKVNLVAVLNSVEDGEVIKKEKPKVKPAAEFKPVKKEPKDSFEEELPEPEEADEEELDAEEKRGFFSRLLDWVIFWR